MRIYLSGYTKETEYRSYVLNNYNNKLNLFEPLIEGKKILPEGFNLKDYNDGKIDLSDHYVSKIVLSEKSEIIKCDILVAYILQFSAGTIMEIEHAYINNIPVFIIDPSKTFRRDIWLRFHTDKFFDDIDDCFDYILQLKESDCRYK